MNNDQPTSAADGAGESPEQKSSEDQFICRNCAKSKVKGQGHTDEAGQEFCCQDCAKRPASIHPNTCEFC